MELIKGKWYKVANHNLYFKYYETKKENEIHYLESIVDTNYINHKDWLSISNKITQVEISEISSFLPENHPDKQLKLEDFIGKWVTCKSDYWEKGSYCLVKSIGESSSEFIIYYSKGFFKPLIDKDGKWTVIYLSDLKIVSETEVAKKAIEYGHDLRELGLHQFISISKTIKKEDLYNTKIWIGGNEELSEKIQRRLVELGFTWKKNNKYEKNIAYIYLYSDGFINKSRDNYKQYELANYREFCFFKNKEITLSDLGLDTKNELLIQKGLEIHKQFEQSLNTIKIIPVIKTTNINIPNIILTNNKLTI